MPILNISKYFWIIIFFFLETQLLVLLQKPEYIWNISIRYFSDINLDPKYPKVHLYTHKFHGWKIMCAYPCETIYFCKLNKCIMEKIAMRYEILEI